MLYYMADKFPEIFSMLRPWEVLALLSYNWPGNVREVERICHEIKWQFTYADRFGYEEPELVSDKLFEINGNEPCGSLFDNISKLRQELFHFGIDFKTLESLLNKFGLGILDCKQLPILKGYTTIPMAGERKEIKPLAFTPLTSVRDRRDK